MFLTLAAAACLGALGGCGGNDSTAADKGPPESNEITKAELISRGDAICRKTDKVQRAAVAAYEKQHGEAHTFGEVEKALKTAALPPIKTEIDGLAALGAPRGDELKIQAIITALEMALKEAERHPNTLLGTEEGEFAAPDKLARAYGFKDCAKAL